MAIPPEQLAALPTPVRAHIIAVESGDPAAMAADYAQHAVIERPGQRIEGRAAIHRYFQDVPARLGGGTVRFESAVSAAGPDGTTATFRWRIDGGPGDGASGADTVVIVDDLITHQTVRLDSADF